MLDAHQTDALDSVSESTVDASLTHAQPDRPTMDLTPQAELTKLRDLLTERRLELRAEIEAAERDQRETSDADAHEVTDRKDEAARQLSSDLGGVQEQRDLDEMAQVEAALQRLDDGTYGNCRDCGQPILLQRLRVQAAAERCTLCQAASEHAMSRHTPKGVS